MNDNDLANRISSAADRYSSNTNSPDNPFWLYEQMRTVQNMDMLNRDIAAAGQYVRTRSSRTKRIFWRRIAWSLLFGAFFWVINLTETGPSVLEQVFGWASFGMLVIAIVGIVNKK